MFFFYTVYEQVSDIVATDSSICQKYMSVYRYDVFTLYDVITCEIGYKSDVT